MIVKLAIFLCLGLLPCTPSQQDDNHVATKCEGNSPKIHIFYYRGTTDNSILHYSDFDQNKIFIAYSTTIEIHCHGEENRLTLAKNEQILTTERLKSDHYNYFIKWFSRNLHVQKSEYEFVCTDVVTACKCLVTAVDTPAITVVSQNVQNVKRGINVSYVSYIALYGNSISILCIGPDATRLVLSKEGDTLLAKQENVTTLKLYEEKPELQILKYVCTDHDMSFSSSVLIKIVPVLNIQLANRIISPDDFENNIRTNAIYRVTYGDNIEVLCTGPQAAELMNTGEDSQDIEVKLVNETTIRFIKKIVTETTVYCCSHNTILDSVSRAVVIIKPRMDVISPSIHSVESRDGFNNYAIKYGNPFEIICSGLDAAQLGMRYAMKRRRYNPRLEVQTVNKTTVKYIRKDPDMDEKIKYGCSSVSGSSSDETFVVIGILPTDVLDFRCVSQNMEILKCTWTAPSNQVNFKLYHVENGVPAHICDKPRTSWKPKLCVWDYELQHEVHFIKNLTFLMETCNGIGCSKQTFYIDHLSVIKVAPPTELIVLNKTSSSAVLQWRKSDIFCAGEQFATLQGDFHFKIQYWYSDINPQEVNSSLVSCDYVETCRVELNLPCPDQFYQVWIYQKLKEGGEEFWSDPSSVTFLTSEEKGKPSITHDQAGVCSWDPKETPDVMKFFIRKFKHQVHLEMEKIAKKVIALKKKRDIIRLYLERDKSMGGV